MLLFVQHQLFKEVICMSEFTIFICMKVHPLCGIDCISKNSDSYLHLEFSSAS